MSDYTFELTCPSFPTQAEGRTADDRPWYFRARHGEWTLEVGDYGWPTPLLEWPDNGAVLSGELIVAKGDDPTHGQMDEDDVHAVLTEHLP